MKGWRNGIMNNRNWKFIAEVIYVASLSGDASAPCRIAPILR
jgi:hypothetical protein